MLKNEETKMMLNPMTGQSLPVIDKSLQLMEKYKSRILTQDELRFHELFTKRRLEQRKQGKLMPVPGGVGYGMFFIVLHFFIIFPRGQVLPKQYYALIILEAD